jgi:hypothetical protein
MQLLTQEMSTIYKTAMLLLGILFTDMTTLRKREREAFVNISSVFFVFMVL